MPGIESETSQPRLHCLTTRVRAIPSTALLRGGIDIRSDNFCQSLFRSPEISSVLSVDTWGEKTVPWGRGGGGVGVKGLGRHAGSKGGGGYAGEVQKTAEGEEKKFAVHSRHTLAHASPPPCQTSADAEPFLYRTPPDANPTTRRTPTSSLVLILRNLGTIAEIAPFCTCGSLMAKWTYAFGAHLGLRHASWCLPSYFLHPKWRKIDVVRILLKLIPLILRRACGAPVTRSKRSRCPIAPSCCSISLALLRAGHGNASPLQRASPSLSGSANGLGVCHPYYITDRDVGGFERTQKRAAEHQEDRIQAHKLTDVSLCSCKLADVSVTSGEFPCFSFSCR